MTYENLLIDTIKASRRLSDYTIIDIPSGRLNVEKRTSLLSSTHVVIIAEPTVKHIHNLGVIYYAIKKLRPNDPPPFFVINKADSNNTAHLDVNVIAENTGITPNVVIPFLSSVIDTAIAKGTPVASITNTEEFTTAIEQLTCLLIGKEFIEEEETSKLGNLFRNLKKTIGL
jgi:pilus assembly protein CpaE